MNTGKYKMVVLGLSLAALTAGLVAGWSLRSPVRRPPEDKPARALSPITRSSSHPGHFIVFSAVKSCPPATPDLLPTANQIYCFYSFPQLAADARIAVHWWHNGKDLGLVTDLQPAEAQISKPGIATDKQEEATNARPGRYIILNPPANEDTFAPGIYEVELYSGDQRLGRGSFVVAADAEKIMAAQPSKVGQVRVVSCVTARGITPTGEPQQPVNKFAPYDRVYVAFAYINGAKGEQLRVEWYGGDQRLESATQKLTMKGAAGRGFAWLQAKDKGLPAGKYRVAVFGAMANEPLSEARFTVQP